MLTLELLQKVTAYNGIINWQNRPGAHFMDMRGGRDKVDCGIKNGELFFF